MTIALALLSVVYVTCLVVLLVISRKKKGLYAAAKGVCSGLFIVCAIMCWAFGPRGNAAQFALLMAALLLCAFGDVLLGVANRRANHVSKKPFVAGAISFTLAHVVFCALFLLRSPFRWHDLILSFILMGVLFILEKTEKIRLKKIRPLGYVYTFMVALMASKAASAALMDGAVSMGEAFITIGAFLFLISDIILLFLYFGTRRIHYMRGANLTTYYLGVYLMSVSCLWM